MQYFIINIYRQKYTILSVFKPKTQPKFELQCTEFEAQFLLVNLSLEISQTVLNIFDAALADYIQNILSYGKVTPDSYANVLR